ncbi:hypothetical protein LZ30DRAFT_258666 [Colletotrichum cereale]|nr:hypothetical protein LZ30DRAFT_258666 [Colletotrichum cereale]
MAEVFGVVVSALTVAGMVSKFSTSIFKLRQLWDEVQDAPEDIRQRIRQLAIVKPMLEEMEAGLRDDGQHRIRDSGAAGLSLEYCRQAADELELLAEDLQGRISRAKRSRGLVKLKVTLKKDVLKRYHERIQFALQLLALSQHTYIIALVKNNSSVGTLVHCSGSQREAGPTRITAGDDHSQRMESTSRADENVDKLPMKSCRRKSSSLVWLGPSVLGGFTYATSTHERDSNTLVYEARVQLPWWISNKVWDLQAHRACQGWKLSISPWITRPDDAPIFRHAAYGSWSDVLDALNRDQASLRDRDPAGWTLLHIAAVKGNVDVFMNLIRLGLSTQETAGMGLLGLQTLVVTRQSAKEVERVMRFLASSGDLDDYFPLLFQRTNEPLIDGFFMTGRSVIRRNISQLVSNFRGLLQVMAAEFQVDPLQLAPSARFAALDWRTADPDVLLDETSRGRALDAASFGAVLGGPDENNLDTFAQAYFFGVQALTYDAHDASDRDFGKEPKIESWRKLARRILPAAPLETLFQSLPGPPLHLRGKSPFFSGLTFLEWYLGCYDMTIREWQGRISRAVVMWLEDVRSSGVSLDEYGAKVRKQYLDNTRLHTWRWHMLGRDKSGPQLVGLTIGPTAEDWKLHWDFDEAEFAGDFWEMIENPPLRIPGGWIDEDVPTSLFIKKGGWRF